MRQSYITRFPIGATIIANDRYVYGVEKPINRQLESHSKGTEGYLGDLCLVLGYFHVKNEKKRENGLYVWHLRTDKRIWIYDKLLPRFDLL